MVCCVVPDCEVNHRNNTNNETFHRFPSDTVVKEKWIRVLNKPNWTPHKYSTVCSKHFDPRCFRQIKSRRLLKKNSVPTKFIPNQLVIRVSDKHDSKTNVFNRFSVSDGYFENNIIVKEEQENHQHENEESSEQMEAEEEPKEFSPGEEMFPAVQAVLGDKESGSEDTSKALKELNDPFRKFVSEYSERTQALRERTAIDRERMSLDREKLALDRARLQYEMTRYGSAQKSDS